MESLFYILKSAGILSIFYLVYTLIMRKETFFNINRSFLLVGILAAILLPLFQYTRIILVEIPALESVQAAAMTANSMNFENGNIFDLIETILIIIYLIGVLVLFARFVYQLFNLIFLLKKYPVKKLNGHKLIEVSKAISPFSFFKYIVVNPLLHTEKELLMILEHEKAHINEYHSVDVITANLLIIFQWFNPLAWTYKKSIEANLEFLADRKTADQVVSRKEYQIALVKASSATLQPALTNYFYKSFIKKRIIMLNKTNSKKRNALKATLVLPLLAIFLLSFNVNEVTKYVEIQSEKIQTKSPLISEEIVISETPSTEKMPAVVTKEKATNNKKTNIQKKFRAIINKNTSDAELQKIKEEVKSKYGIDISYAAIRNKSNEITSLTLSYNGNGNNGNYQLSQDQGIDEFYFFIDEDGKTGFWSEATEKRLKERDIKRKEHMKERNHDTKHRNMEMEERIEQRKAELEERRSLMIRRRGEATGNDSVYFIPNNKVKRNSTNSKKPKLYSQKDSPIFFINGKEASDVEAKKLLPADIDKVNVLKDEKAIKKYGVKGVNGVIEIITKKQ